MDIYLENSLHNEDEVKSVLAHLFSLEQSEVLIVNDFYEEFVKTKLEKKVVCEIGKYDEYGSRFSTCLTIYCYVDGGINLWNHPDLLYSIMSGISQKLKVRCMISYRVPDNCMYLFDPYKRHQKVVLEGDEIMTISSFVIDLRFDRFVIGDRYVDDFRPGLDEVRNRLINISALILNVNRDRIVDQENCASYATEDAVFLSIESDWIALSFGFRHRLRIYLPINELFQPMEDQWLEINDLTFAKAFSREINSRCLIQDLSLRENEFMQINPNGDQSIYTLHPYTVFFR